MDCGGSSVDMGPRRDVSLAQGVVLDEAFGAVRVGRLVWSIDSFEFVGTEKVALTSQLESSERPSKG